MLKQRNQLDVYGLRMQRFCEISPDGEDYLDAWAEPHLSRYGGVIECMLRFGPLY